MFLKNSRYYGQSTVSTTDSKGREVQAVTLRRLPDTSGDQVLTTQDNRLDRMSKTQYKDPTQFWHIADANSELEANALVEEANRVISVPK